MSGNNENDFLEKSNPSEVRSIFSGQSTRNSLGGNNLIPDLSDNTSDLNQTNVRFNRKTRNGNEHNIKSIIERLDTVTNNLETENVEFMTQDGLCNVIEDMRLDLLSILRLVETLNENIVRDNREISDLKSKNVTLMKEVDYLKHRISSLNDTQQTQFMKIEDDMRSISSYPSQSGSAITPEHNNRIGNKRSGPIIVLSNNRTKSRIQNVNEQNNEVRKSVAGIRRKLFDVEKRLENPNGSRSSLGARGYDPETLPKSNQSSVDNSKNITVIPKSRTGGLRLSRK